MTAGPVGGGPMEKRGIGMYEAKVYGAMSILTYEMVRLLCPSTATAKGMK